MAPPGQSLASSLPQLRAEDYHLALVIDLGSPKGGGRDSGEGEPQVLQEVELLMNGLLPTLGEVDGELQRPRKQQPLKETRPLSDPIRKSRACYIPGFLTGHTCVLSSGARWWNYSAGEKPVKEPW